MGQEYQVTPRRYSPPKGWPTVALMPKISKKLSPQKKYHFKILHSPAPYNQGGRGEGGHTPALETLISTIRTG